ncbi:MAG TPA: hypothetical protein VGH58_09520 [Solirubrobacterales bacterium]
MIENSLGACLDIGFRRPFLDSLENWDKVVYDDKIGEAEIAEPSPRSPIRSCPRPWVASLSPPAPFLLALVRVRPFQWS